MRAGSDHSSGFVPAMRAGGSRPFSIRAMRALSAASGSVAAKAEAQTRAKAAKLFLIEINFLIAAGPQCIFLPAVDAGGHDPVAGVEIEGGDGRGFEEERFGGGEQRGLPAGVAL